MCFFPLCGYWKMNPATTVLHLAWHLSTLFKDSKHAFEPTVSRPGLSSINLWYHFISPFVGTILTWRTSPTSCGQYLLTCVYFFQVVFLRPSCVWANLCVLNTHESWLGRSGVLWQPVCPLRWLTHCGVTWTPYWDYNTLHKTQWMT